jgi:hypothetical protein
MIRRLPTLPFRPPTALRAALLCAGLSAGTVAWATVDLALRLETSLSSNSNLFRVAEPGTATVPVPTEVVSARAQRYLMAFAAGLPLDSDDTRLVLTTQLGWDRYNGNNNINNQSKEVTARLPWRFGKLVEGEWVKGHTTLPYALDQDYQRLDLVTRDWHGMVVTLKPTPWLSFPAQVVRQTLRHQDQLAHGNLDENRTRTSLAARYLSPTGSSVQLGSARTQATFPRRGALPELANRAEFTDQDTFVDLTWNYSPLTQLSWRWTNRQRHYAAAPELDSHMVLSRLNLSHAPSPLSRVDVQWWQQPTETDNPALLYGATRGFGIGINWFATPLSTLTLQWQQESQEDKPSAPGNTFALENPKTRRLTARLQHNIVRGVNAFVDVTRETRTRERLGRSAQNVVRVGLDYTYDNIPGAVARTRAAPAPEF